MAKFRIGTRKSAMALAQTDEIARQLSRAVPGIDVEIVKFETTGISTRLVSCCPMVARAERSSRKSVLRYWRASCTRRCIR